MIIEPLNGYVIVQALDPERFTQGGLILPDSAVKPSRRALVLAAKPWIDAKGLQHEPDVKPGDCVLVPKFLGESFLLPGRNGKEMDQDEIIFFRHEDILAVIPIDSRVESNAKAAITL